ncbi:MAG: helix-turn-helix transcriptional regulator [Phycisphaerae bacterium]|nr:helix-turn-helix transcriptional regulator [Phycisphaerae bacterium]
MRSSEFVKVAKALADPTRLRMLEGIRAAGKQTCSEVCSCFKLSQPTISHHIKMLESSGVIHARKSGAFHVLSVNETLLRAFARHAAGEAPKGAVRRGPIARAKKGERNGRHGAAEPK